MSLHSESAVRRLIELRHEEKHGWCVFGGVANGTGSRASRYCDALAMAVWPSRGLELHGFEIKVSRQDLMRELKDPSKAEEIACYCDYWWIVLGDAKLCKAEEIPRNWGLLAPAADDKKLVVVKAAVKLKAKAMDRTFLAAILRRAHEAYAPQAWESRAKIQLRQDLEAELVEKAHKKYEKVLAAKDQQIADANAREAEAQAALRRATGSIADPKMISAAIRLLSDLSQWNGGRSNVRSVENCVHRAKEGLLGIEHSIAAISSLYDQLEGKDEAAQ